MKFVVVVVVVVVVVLEPAPELYKAVISSAVKLLFQMPISSIVPLKKAPALALAHLEVLTLQTLP